MFDKYIELVIQNHHAIELTQCIKVFTAIGQAFHIPGHRRSRNLRNPGQQVVSQLIIERIADFAILAKENAVFGFRRVQPITRHFFVEVTQHINAQHRMTTKRALEEPGVLRNVAGG
ncbi:hypothetical protein D9M71_309150 [compost metagenome]